MSHYCGKHGVVLFDACCECLESAETEITHLRTALTLILDRCESDHDGDSESMEIIQNIASDALRK